jgi:hypothetical protein
MVVRFVTFFLTASSRDRIFISQVGLLKTEARVGKYMRTADPDYGYITYAGNRLQSVSFEATNPLLQKQYSSVMDRVAAKCQMLPWSSPTMII